MRLNINPPRFQAPSGEEFNLRKLETAKIAPPPDWLEDQVQAQNMFCDLRVIITSGQWARKIINQTPLPSVFFS